MNLNYEILIYWNNSDEVFVAEIPELNGCVTHGETEIEALKEVKLLAQEWVKIATEKGWFIPEPKGRLTFA